MREHYGTGDGGGVYLGSTTTVYAKNVILAGNTDASTSGNVRHDCSGTLTSQGYNHIQSTTGCTISGTTTGNQTGTSAQLNALANNGGPTMTHASQGGSPVINTGTNTGCPAQDQRGYNRDGSCDKGAYEYGASAPVPPSTSPITTTYYYAGAQLIALREITATGNTLYFVHTDHLGSVSAVSCGNTSGACPGGFALRAVVGRQYYRPYGGPRGAAVSLPTDRAFTGQVRDATGLDYFKARYFSSSLGRFISADSIAPGAGNPQNLNRYAFVLGNPLKYTDPAGHIPNPGCTGTTIADCGVDGWYGIEDYETRQTLLAMGNRARGEVIEDFGQAVAVIGSVLFEPVDWAVTGYDCITGNCSPLVLIGLLPVIPASFGNRVDDVVPVGGLPPLSANFAGLEGADLATVQSRIPSNWTKTYSPYTAAGTTLEQWRFTSPSGLEEIRIKEADPRWATGIQLRWGVQVDPAGPYGSLAGQNPLKPGEFWLSLDNSGIPAHYTSNLVHTPLTTSLAELVSILGR